MNVNYKKIAEAQETFKKLSSVEMDILDAIALKEGILELDEYYGYIDKYKEKLLHQYASKLPNGEWEFKEENSEKNFIQSYEKYLEIETKLTNFPVTIRKSDRIKLSAIDMIRISDLIHFI